jgi:hypothetical protein
VDHIRNGVCAPVAQERVPGVSGRRGLNVHLAPLARARLEASADVAKTIAAKPKVAQISSDYGQQQE